MHETHLKASFVVNSMNIVFAFRIPHSPSQAAFPQGLCIVTQISCSNPSAQADCCSALTANMADAYAWWNIFMYSFHIFLLFFSFFTVLLPLSSITDMVFSYTRSPLFLLLKANFSLHSASFAPLSSSAIFFPFSHLFVEAVSADSYKRENPLCSHSAIPPTLSLRAFVPRPS